MEMNDKVRDVELLDLPDGFNVAGDGSDEIIIRHKRTGMRGSNIFMIVMVIGWTMGCAAATRKYFDDNMEYGNLIGISIFWAIQIGLMWLVLYCLFARKIFRVTRNSIGMKTSVLGIKWNRIIDKNQIRSFDQVMDCMGNDKSFHGWGLAASGDKDIKLIRWQRYEKSYWLGRYLSDYYGVEFYEWQE